jgi:hypothetical protein
MGFDSKANWVEAILKTDLVLALAAFLRADAGRDTRGL